MLLQTLFYIVNVKEKKIHFLATFFFFFFANFIPLLGPFLSGANLLLFAVSIFFSSTCQPQRLSNFYYCIITSVSGPAHLPPHQSPFAASLPWTSVIRSWMENVTGCEAGDGVGFRLSSRSPPLWTRCSG